MSDFHFSTTLLRGQVSAFLAESPEHLVWVLADLTSLVSLDDLEDCLDSIDEDPERVAVYYPRLSEALHPDDPAA